MRQLLAAFGLFGLVLGLAAAVVLHSLPAVLVGGGYGWFAYSSELTITGPTSLYLVWTPSLLTLGSLGLVTGLLIAVVLGRLGWRLMRPSQ